MSPLPQSRSGPRRSGPRRSGPRPLRLLYACTTLVILVLLATNAAIILHLLESTLLGEENQLKNLSLTLAEEADRSFQSLDLVLSNLAERMTAEGIADAASFERYMGERDVSLRLRDKIVGMPQIAAVNLIDSRGKLINTSRFWPPASVDVSDRDFFRALTSGRSLKTYISQPYQNRSTGTWTIYLARRFEGPGGELIGLILGAMEMRYLEDFYRAIALGEGSTIVVLRQDGVMLARYPPAPADTIGKIFSASRNVLRGEVAGTLREISEVDGQMKIKAARLLANYPVLILATKTEEAALSDWRDIARLMSLGALGCAVSIALAGLALGRQWKQQTILAAAQAELRRQEDRIASFETMAAAKEAAEMADRTKTEFLATMSHELRTPLNAIIGFSDMMVSEAIGPLGNDRYRGYARDIHASGHHLLAIINDVLDVSKAAAGKLELAESWIDARDAVETVCRFVRPRIAEAQLHLAVNLPPGELILYADERKLKQMLLNLLSNAYKFTPRGGLVACSVIVDAAGIKFAVSDTGIGIPAEQLDRVLQPFVQVSSTLSRQHDGTGLGLTLVKAMAELHGGTLRLESEIGVGTTAAVTLPRARLKTAGVSEGDEPSPREQPRRIAVASRKSLF